MTGNAIEPAPWPITWLFVPADRPDRIVKAFSSGADAVIVDLEDAVPVDGKAHARGLIAGILSSVDRSRLAVRVNPPTTRDGLADMQALLAGDAAPAYLVLPKCESPGVLRQIDALLTESGKETALIALVETAAGLIGVERLARATPRLKGVMFGAADMTSDLACRPGGELLRAAQQRIVIACAAAHVAAIDSPSFSIDDPDAIASDALHARDMGFSGKAAIHPRQLAAIMDSFRASPEDLERAHRIVALAERGAGVVDGQMIDEAMAKSARVVLARWGEPGGQRGGAI